MFNGKHSEVAEIFFKSNGIGEHFSIHLDFDKNKYVSHIYSINEFASVVDKPNAKDNQLTEMKRARPFLLCT